MSGRTGIEWTDRTWNPVVGCTKVSQGCKLCYAKTIHDMRHAAHLAGKKVAPQYSEPFETVQLMPDRLTWRLEDRLHDHRTGGSKCARLMHAVNKAGIGWKVARLWRGGRTDERRLKTLGGAARLYPICTPGTKRGATVPAYRPRKMPEGRAA